MFETPNLENQNESKESIEKISMNKMEFAETVLHNGRYIESPLNSKNFNSTSEREGDHVKKKQASYLFNGKIYLLKFDITYGPPAVAYNPSNGSCEEFKELVDIQEIENNF